MANLKPGIYYGPAKKTPAMRRFEAKMNAKLAILIKASDAAQEQAKRDIMYLRAHRDITC